MNKNDLRVIKTKKAVKNAFAKLLMTKKFEDITVTDIVQLAEINRKTFYSHYTGTYEVLDEIESEMMADLIISLGDVNTREMLKSPYQVFEKITDFINRDYDFYFRVLSMRDNTELLAHVKEYLKRRQLEEMITMTDRAPEELDVILEYVFSGILAAYQHWFRSERHLSLDELSHIVADTCFHGVQDILA